MQSPIKVETNAFCFKQNNQPKCLYFRQNLARQQKQYCYLAVQNSNTDTLHLGNRTNRKITETETNKKKKKGMPNTLTETKRMYRARTIGKE